MTNPVHEPQPQPQPAVQPDPPVEFDVYTPSFAPQQPVSAPMAPVAPPKPKKTGIVVLSLFVVLLFGAGAAFGVLFFLEKDRSAGLSKQVESKDREIADLTRKAENSKDDAVRAVDAQKKAEADAAASAKCRTAAKSLTEAALNEDLPKGEAAMRDIVIQC
ncbi:hypothetical protein BBK82_24000 [Lentzea guizhouensis]|uniref:Uncharacterized protein n=1 Tax=Lentzea guizhouensis TaxID=1586287 RepID=A0A1B2HLS5_9PSEU|nr:hypothetical protein [Lentzea guizhouensis]ANZ38669.1 hypothetical protein BBK82_24000 [Lentzea guizhouensis]